MAAILGFEHVLVYTNDLRESVEFYEKLGGHVRQYDDVHWPNRVIHMALVDIGSATVELSERYEYQKIDYSFLPCICYFSFEVDDLPQFVAELRASGIDTFETRAINTLELFGGVTMINLRGPSNEKIVLFQKK